VPDDGLIHLVFVALLDDVPEPVRVRTVLRYALRAQKLKCVAAYVPLAKLSAGTHPLPQDGPAVLVEGNGSTYNGSSAGDGECRPGPQHPS
jgi:hypothetical protein